jgi:hypothetical protein
MTDVLENFDLIAGQRKKSQILIALKSFYLFDEIGVYV